MESLKSIFNSINTPPHSSSLVALIGLVMKHSKLFILPVNPEIHSPRSRWAESANMTSANAVQAGSVGLHIAYTSVHVWAEYM